MTAPERAGQAAPTPEEMHQLALRVAVLGVREEDAKGAYTLARKVAAPRFALARKLGVKQQAVMLPGGVEAGLLALKQGGTTVEVDEDALLLLIAPAMPSETEDHVTDAAQADPRTVELLAEHCPDLVELRVKDGALRDDRALKVLAGHAPDLVELRIRPAFRAEMQDYLEKHEGCVPDPTTGEPVKVAEITHHDPAGDFSWTGKSRYLGRVREALASGCLAVTEAGDVVETIAGEVVRPAAIPAPEPPAEPDPDFGVPGDRLFFAEDGDFKSPELAALHATEVQGGFSTPEREARRMARGSGAGADRAKAWLSERGLPSEGGDAA